MMLAYRLYEDVSKHKAEVDGMLATEYNKAEVKELFKEEGRAEERANGA